MTLKTRITTAIATGAVLVNALAPIAFADEIQVTGNGAFSDNTAKVESSSKTVVDQSNNADITNKIESNANTGGNSGSFNTGGDTKIVTGDAVNKVDVSTAVNVNKADLSTCDGCGKDGTDVKISGNGAYSDNAVKVDDSSLTKLSQDNNADIDNKINANSNTGKNDSSFNTGGDNIIVTGDAKNKVDVSNVANANIAEIGGGKGDSHGSSVKIIGNGAFSDNKAKLDQNSAVILDQDNKADIDNKIKSNANTGKNDAGFNTGGKTAIVTGDAVSKVDVDNKVNFNAASLDCGCVLEDLDIKISGNGAKSENTVKADVDNVRKFHQDNYADIYNDILGNTNTGKNDVSFSTGSVYGDPLIVTGDAWSATDVSNKGNVNLLNEGHGLHLPGDWNVNATFDLGDLLSHLFHQG